MSDARWVSIADSRPSDISASDQMLWKALLIERMRTGMMPAIATRWTKRWINDPYGNDTEPTFAGNPKDCWDGVATMAMYRPSEVKEDEELELNFWIDEMSNVNNNWTKIDWGSFGYANWRSGDFASSRIWSDPFKHQSDSRYVIWAINVKVDCNLMRHFNNNFVQNAEIKSAERLSKYDWIASLQYLIAVAEIDGLVSDPNAHGAQASVEKKLADWFAVNAGKQPSEASIRPYAAKVVQAVRDYGNKRPNKL